MDIIYKHKGYKWIGTKNVKTIIFCLLCICLSTILFSQNLSDERTKINFTITDNAKDLETLNKILVIDYKNIDSFSGGQSGNKLFKKAIAQQVEDVYPQAVATKKGFLPNIYSMAKSIEEVEEVGLKINVDKKLDAEFVVGRRVQFYDIDSKALYSVITQVNLEHNFFIVNKIKYNKNEGLFVYGVEVPDLMLVDYEAITMLNVSATQALIKQNLQFKNDIELLNQKVEVLTKSMEQLNVQNTKEKTNLNKRKNFK